MKSKTTKEFDESQASADELWDYCMAEYENRNPMIKFLLNNFFSSIQKIICDFETESSVLEVGCGAGESSRRIFSMLSSNQTYEASDYDSRYIKKILDSNPPYMVKQESVYNSERANNEFDVVIMLEVLEHLENPNLALQELFRVSKQYVIISVPNEPLWRIANLLRLKYIKDFGNTPGHINHYSAKGIRNIILPYGRIIGIFKPFPWLIVLAKKH